MTNSVCEYYKRGQIACDLSKPWASSFDKLCTSCREFKRFEQKRALPSRGFYACPIRLGMSREELRSVCGEPDDKGGTSRKYPEPAIWKYGELEFHFGPKTVDPLVLIFLERDEAVRV